MTKFVAVRIKEEVWEKLYQMKGPHRTYSEFIEEMMLSYKGELMLQPPEEEEG